MYTFYVYVYMLCGYDKASGKNLSLIYLSNSSKIEIQIMLNILNELFEDYNPKTVYINFSFFSLFYTNIGEEKIN